jgi:hypothetical protein
MNKIFGVVAAGAAGSNNTKNNLKKKGWMK